MLRSMHPAPTRGWMRCCGWWRSARKPLKPQTGKVIVRAQGRLLLVDQKEICFVSIEGGRSA